jgi:hypothetical protein
VAPKIYSQAKHCKKLRDSGIFDDNAILESALLIAVVQHVYILFNRDTKAYHFISLSPDQSYNNLLILDNTKRLDLQTLAVIVESLKETIPHG